MTYINTHTKERKESFFFSCYFFFNTYLFLDDMKRLKGTKKKLKIKISYYFYLLCVLFLKRRIFRFQSEKEYPKQHFLCIGIHAGERIFTAQEQMNGMHLQYLKLLFLIFMFKSCALLFSEFPYTFYILSQC